MEFKVFDHRDIENIRHLQPEGWPDIVPAFREYLELNYCYPVKMVIDSKITGLGVSIIFGSNAWLAHIIVDKEYRNQGLGRKMLDFLLEGLQSKPIQSISLIATELGLPVYLKAGFSKVTEYAFFTREKILVKFLSVMHINSTHRINCFLFTLAFDFKIRTK